MALAGRQTSSPQVVHLSAAGAALWTSARGAFTGPGPVSVNSTDGSCWIGAWDPLTSVRVRTAAPRWSTCPRWGRSWGDGPPASSPGQQGVSVDSTDGSCWVAGSTSGEVVHLSAAGTELWRSASGAFAYPWHPAVNPRDGSCWVLDGDLRCHYRNLPASVVVHLASGGRNSGGWPMAHSTPCNLFP